MPVEDIDFLLKNSEKDSYLFFIDSTQRDKDTYPTVSEYEVRFTEPFSNVFSLEVLDAMIPSTRYTIDVGREIFKYHLAFLNPIAYTSINNEKDVKWMADLKAFHNMKSFRKYVDLDTPEIDGYYNYLTVFEKGALTISSYSAVPTPYKTVEVTYLPFTSEDIQVLANGQSYDSSLYDRFVENNVEYVVSKSYVNYEAILPYIARGDIHVDYDSMTAWVIDIYSLSVETYHDVNFTTSFGSTYRYTNSQILFTLANVKEQLEHGNYDIYTFQSYLTGSLVTRLSYLIGDTTYMMPFNSASSGIPNVIPNSNSGTIEKQSKYRFTYTSQNVRFYINLTQTQVASALGFASKAPTKGQKLLYSDVTNWPRGGEFIISTIDDGGSKIIVSPGVANLNGLSYVILRCPEIESHMYNSFSYSKNCPGIGMFKLGSLNQIFNVRFDFVNFIKKPFHPIGRLPKITLRFETTDGDPYDFKGVDHHMLLSVKFYVPRPKEPQHRYILNPNYNPNFLEYMINDMNVDDEQDDEAKEWDRTLDDKQTVLRRKYERLIHEQNEYDYSSEDDQDSETDIIGRYSAR